MKASKINILIMVVSLMLFVATIGLIITMSKIDKQTEDTTTFYTATVTGINITNTGENVFAEIYTKEFNSSLYISTNICKNIKMDDVKDLRNGQMIFFGIENIKAYQMNKVEFVNITSLKTDTKDILTLDEYNKSIYESARPARVVSIIMASLFLCISLFCCLKIKKNKSAKNDATK